MKMRPLSKYELMAFLPLFQNFKHVLKDEVKPFEQNLDSWAFVKSYLQSLGIKKPVISECGIYQFSSVSMHTDNISKSNFSTILFFLKGCGHLSLCQKINPFKILTFELNAGDVCHFEFKWPHAFESSKQCFAIIADVLTKQIKRIKS